MPAFFTAFRRAILVPTALLAVAACGGGAGQAVSIDVVMTDFAFTASEWTVAAGDEITLNLDNQGSVIHNWALVKAGSEISSEGDLPIDPAEKGGLYVLKNEVVAGETASVTLTAPPPGTYQVICDIQAHFSVGMAGTLTVE